MTFSVLKTKLMQRAQPFLKNLGTSKLTKKLEPEGKQITIAFGHKSARNAKDTAIIDW